MENFFAQTEGRWPAGREDYCWHVLPGPGELSGQYQQLQQWPGLAAVRAEWMHVTVQHLAPAAEVSGADLGRMVRLVRGRCGGIAPFTVTAGRAEAWEAGVVRLVRPADLLRFLRQVITGISDEVGIGRFGAHDASYCPHLTLAYAVAHADQEQVRAQPNRQDQPAWQVVALCGDSLDRQRQCREDEGWEGDGDQGGVVEAA
jgi:2'-5' RNA ligase